MRTGKYLLPILVIAVVGLANFYPTITQVAGQCTLAFSLTADGTATTIKNGKNKAQSFAAHMELCGDATQTDNEVKLSNLKGTLKVGLDPVYNIIGGNGEISLDNMKFEIQGKVSNGKELVLHGYFSGDQAYIQKPQSKLASIYFLEMNGPYSLTLPTSSSSSSSASAVTVTETTTITSVTTETTTATDTATVTETVTVTTGTT